MNLARAKFEGLRYSFHGFYSIEDFKGIKRRDMKFTYGGDNGGFSATISVMLRGRLKRFGVG